MISFIELQLSELLLRTLRDLSADAFPRAAAGGIALVIATAVVLRARRALRRGRGPQRPLPAAA